jgi:protein-tyrosine-phosphatase
MALGFARTYGADIMTVESAGLAPAASIPPLTRKVMLERKIELGDATPRSLDQLTGGFDLIINLSGHELPFKTAAPVENWKILDPIGQTEDVYRDVRDEIEKRVKELIYTLRKRKPAKATEHAKAAPAAQVDTRRRSPGK